MPCHFAQATQQELAEAQATVAQLEADLADARQQSTNTEESMRAAMQAQAVKAQQHLAHTAAAIEEAQAESEQVCSNICQLVLGAVVNTVAVWESQCKTDILLTLMPALCSCAWRWMSCARRARRLRTSSVSMRRPLANG